MESGGVQLDKLHDNDFTEGRWRAWDMSVNDEEKG